MCYSFMTVLSLTTYYSKLIFNILLGIKNKMELSKVSKDNHDLRINQIIKILIDDDGNEMGGLSSPGKINQFAIDQLKDRSIPNNLELYNTEYDRLSKESIVEFPPYVLLFYDNGVFYVTWSVDADFPESPISLNRDQMKFMISLIHQGLTDNENNPISSYNPK